VQTVFAKTELTLHVKYLLRECQQLRRWPTSKWQHGAESLFLYQFFTARYMSAKGLWLGRGSAQSTNLGARYAANVPFSRHNYIRYY